MQQIIRATKVNQYSVHIKIIDTSSKYKCIMVWSNDPGQVNRGKGYKTVDRLDCSTAVWGVDGVYLGPDCGYKQHSPPLTLRQILIVSRSAQYVVYGGPRFRQELCAGRYSFDRKSGLSSVDYLSDISPEVVASAPWTISRIFFDIGWSHARGLCDNHTSKTGCAMLDLTGWVWAI